MCIRDRVSTAHNLPFQKQLQELLHSDERLGALLCDPVEGGSKQLAKSLHPQVFAFDPRTGCTGPVALLFDYRHRDLLGAARCVEIKDEIFSSNNR